jgi:hypothetical protein
MFCMKTEKIEIGPTPAEEPAADIGAKDYDAGAANLLECRVFKAQLEKEFPKGMFTILRNSHEFGTYREVAVCYDGVDPEQDEAASAAESGCNTRWTPESIDALRAGGYPARLLAEIEKGRAAQAA